jgi:hypothetical protein
MYTLYLHLRPHPRQKHPKAHQAKSSIESNQPWIFLSWGWLSPTPRLARVGLVVGLSLTYTYKLGYPNLALNLDLDLALDPKFELKT